MNTRNIARLLYAACVVFTMFYSMGGFALENIIRPYQSIRTASMGGLKLTTGLYDENFYGNPARALANPRAKLTIMDPTFEINSGAISTIGDMAGSSGDTVQKLSNTAGTNNHPRIQMSLASLYMTPIEDRKWAAAVGVLQNIQADVALRRSYNTTLQPMVDFMPSFTFAYKLGANDEFGVGLNTRFDYRFTTDPGYSVADMIKRSSFRKAGGGTLDFDLGGTYLLPFEVDETKFTAGLAIDSLLAGKFSTAHTGDTGFEPPAQNRAIGFGVAAHKASVGSFGYTTAGIELQDIGNNPNGSFFRLVHLGGETRYGVLVGRLGINQGYLGAGIGLDLRFLTLDFATYGEEMGLNVGDMEDRRYAFRFALQI